MPGKNNYIHAVNSQRGDPIPIPFRGPSAGRMSQKCTGIVDKKDTETVPETHRDRWPEGHDIPCPKRATRWIAPTEGMKVPRFARNDLCFLL